MTISVGGIEFQLVRSARRSVSIHVERDGSVTVRAPLKVDKARLLKVVEKKLQWVYRNVALWKELNKDAPRREFVSGESFYVAGQPCILDVRDEAEMDLFLDGNHLILRRSSLLKADELLRAMYRSLGYERLPKLVQNFARIMDVSPGKLRVWELHNRWASCSAAGNLNFHWRAMTLPLDVLEYLVVHELAHLKHPNHTKEFWGEVQRAYPAWEKAAAWLQTNGAGKTL